MTKPTTSLPPISDIFRGPSINDSYYPPQNFGQYRAVPAHPANYSGPQYQLSTTEYAAPRYYNPAYAAPNYSFAGETAYGPARDSRDHWRPNGEAPHQLPSPLQMQPSGGPYAHPTQRGSSMPEVGMRTPEFGGSQSSSRNLSPKFNHSAMASQSKVRTRNNLPKEVTHVLLQWLNDHLNHPYPNSFEKAQLIMATGLNQQQLSNWFINARRRKIKYLREKQNARAV
ncbi:hypothetical protein OXX79_004860 [Metschnikowia pulcherrima]